jgi:hypothetical protein
LKIFILAKKFNSLFRVKILEGFFLIYFFNWKMLFVTNNNYTKINEFMLLVGFSVNHLVFDFKSNASNTHSMQKLLRSF